MMAAIEAGKNNKKVLLLEKNSQLGNKLLITGKNRCNITNNESNKNSFLSKYGKEGKQAPPQSHRQK